MRKLLLSLCLLSVLFTACTSDKATPDEIVLNLEKGSTYTSNQVNNTSIDQTIQGQDIHFDMKIGAMISFKVEDIVDDVYVMETMYENMHMSMKNSFINIDIDTRNEQADSINIFAGIMHTIMKNIMNKPFTVKMDKHGEIQSIDGIAAAFENAVAKVSEEKEMDDQTRATVMQQLRESYGDEAFKSSFEIYMNFYPEQPVEVKDTWNKKIEMKSTVTGTYDVTYTLNSIDKGQYNITGEGKFNSENDDYSLVSGMQMKYNMTGGYNVDMKVSKKTGWIEEASIEQTLEGDVDVKPSEQLPDGMTFPMSMKAITTIKQ